MLWYNDDFELVTKINRINYVFLDKAKNDKNYNEIINLQGKYRNMFFDNNDIEMEIDSEPEEEITLKHKKVKKPIILYLLKIQIDNKILQQYIIKQQKRHTVGG